MKKYLEAGKITSTHAVKGEVRVQPWCNSTEAFCELKTLYLDGEGRQRLSVKSRPSKNVAIMKISGVDTVEQADALRNKVLYMNRADLKLEDGEYFIQDIIGLEVKNAVGGTSYGRVTDVFNTGANDIYTVTAADGKAYYIPVIDEVVNSVDPEGGEILITPMKGLFSDED